MIRSGVASPYAALTFDCFGTLIDWEAGERRVLRQFPSLASKNELVGPICRRRQEVEREFQSGSFRPYAEVLELSIARAAQDHGVTLTASEMRAFAAGQAGWPAFPDSVEALARLAPHFRIALVSNCDYEVLRMVARNRLGLSTALLVAADHVGSYKPAPGHFEKALALLKQPASQVLHVSFSPFHDLEPAARHGLRLAFVGRGTETPSTHPLDMAADSLAELAGLLLQDVAAGAG